ncbi:MAG: EAL domain-containing protein [Alphaproteobacteria bacterium]
MAPDDSGEWSSLLRTAEDALTRAESYATGRFAFADAERDARWRIGPLLAGAIAEALATDQFQLAYQPIARLSDGKRVGAEALLRWPRPGGEMWPPAIFIPEAERRGLMEPITAWTLQAACKMLARIDDPADFRIGVNLSAAMLGLGSAEMIEGVLSSTGATAERLTVEITETAALLDGPAALDDVAAIAALGCGVAIDDFGAGQASLGYVVKLPANRIKLDASLIDVFETNVRARAAIAATAQLAMDIGADVVAEGVRSAEAAASLAALGVALGQGAFYGMAKADPFA